MRDGDNEQKSKNVAYARRSAKNSEVLHRNQELLNQERKDKLSTWFDPDSHTVDSKHGNNLIVKYQEGIQYSRNSSHVKRLPQNGETPRKQEGINSNWSTATERTTV